MKKIQLKVSTVAESTRIIFKAFIKCDNPRMFGLVEFIVDTGSPITLISSKDRERFRISGIQMRAVKSRKVPITIGGGNVEAKIIPEVEIKIDGFNVKMPIHVVDTSRSSSHPSILGIDFLLENKLRLVFEPTNNEAFFEFLE